MEAPEFDGWMRYWAEEPWGFTQANLMAGVIAAATVNSSLNKRKGHIAKASDFMFRTAEEQREDETEDAFNALWAVGEDG